MEGQNKNNRQRGGTIAGAVLIAFVGVVLIILIWSMAVTVMNALKPHEETSETMQFTPGFHHFETNNENTYLNALTEIDAYGADGKIEIVDISIVYSANTVTPHYHITYKV